MTLVVMILDIKPIKDLVQKALPDFPFDLLARKHAAWRDENEDKGDDKVGVQYHVMKILEERALLHFGKGAGYLMQDIFYTLLLELDDPAKVSADSWNAYKYSPWAIAEGGGLSSEIMDEETYQKILKSRDLPGDKEEKKHEIPKPPAVAGKAVLSKKDEAPKNSFYKDMVKEARKPGMWQNIVGRDKEINQLECALAKLNKSNAVLLGKTGVGKTAVVEALAQRIASRQSHHLLWDTELLSINIGELVAGTCWRGDLEKRIKDILIRAEKNKSILFIDEIHQLASYRSESEGIMDMLKEKTGRGAVRLIGATTDEEYRKIEDAAFRRRFTEIQIPEPTEDMTLQILRGMRPKYTRPYEIRIDLRALREIVDVSARFIHNRNFPDKAIDLLASSCVAATARKERVLYERHIHHVAAEQLNIPKNMIAAGEKKSILSLEEKLRKNIFGQDAAISEISETLAVNYAFRRDASRPESVLFFAGPSGVGKTETAEVLAKQLCRDFVRLNMNEFQSEMSVSKLGGAEPGYIGYEKGGQLTNAVMKKPYAVILMDEFEKAHGLVQDALLQAFDKGIFTDSGGREYSLRNNIIIMSSNAGVDYSRPVGFGAKADAYAPEVSDEKLKKIFLPEFLGRVNKIVKFRALTKSALDMIFDKLVSDLDKSVVDGYGHSVVVEYDAKASVIEAGASPELGARMMKDAFRDIVEKPLAKYLLRNRKEIPYGAGIIVRGKHPEIVVEAYYKAARDANQLVH
jgi:ATP-dependent Clp protease ATP-binding subunit ClpA